MEFLVVLAVLVLVALFVTRPLWRAAEPDTTRPERRPSPADELAELEAARDAKYREIRDAELDHQTGKLSQEDFEATDRSLRAEALKILKALDAARERLPSSQR